MILPPPCWIMCAPNSLQAIITALTLTANSLSHSSMGYSVACALKL